MSVNLNADLGALLAEIVRASVREAVVDALGTVNVNTLARPARLLSKSELADALGISTAKVDRLCRQGAIPFVRVGDVRRFDLDAVLESLKVKAPAEATSAEHPPCGRRVVTGVRLISRGPR